MRIMLTRDRPSENRREYVEDIKGREELGNRDATHLNVAEISYLLQRVLYFPPGAFRAVC